MSEWPLPELPRQWTGTVPPPFVGRDREFALLEDAWAAVERGARQVILVGGEPGVGKSRLAAQAGCALHAHGVPVLVGGCLPDLGATYDPFVEPVETLLPHVESGTIELAGRPSDVAERLELLRLLAGGARQADTRSVPLFSPAIFEAATAVLIAASVARPLLLVLEDVHWAGETAVALLRYLIERTGNARIMMIATLRTPTDRSSRLGRVIPEAYRLPGVTRLDLGPLDAEQIADYLVRGAHANAPLARRAATVLLDHTGGNPFLLREVCRDIDARSGWGVLTDQALRAPESVRETVEARLGSLTADERRVVDTAAVIGEAFSLALVVASVARGGTPVSTAAVFAALDAAQECGFVEWMPGAQDGGRFTHSLARAAVLDSMTVYARAQVHASVAQALEEDFPAAPLRVERLAHHYANASVLGQREKACHYLTAAADLARARLAHGDAADLYENASAYAQGVDWRNELRLSAARSHLEASHLLRSRELNHNVFSDSAGEQRLRAAIGFEAATWRTAEPGDQAIRMLGDALVSVPPDPTNPYRIRALGALGRAHASVGHAAESLATTRTALDLAQRLGEPRLLSAVLQASLHNGGAIDDLEDRLRRADELTALVASNGDVHHLGAAAFHRGVIHYLTGNAGAFTTAHTDLARTARATQQSYWQWASGNFTFSCQLLRCEFDSARSTLSELAELGSTFDGVPGQTDGAWSLQSYMLRRETGGLERVRHLVTGTEDPQGMWAPGLLALYTELEMGGAARDVLQQILRRDLDRYRSSSSWPATLSFLTDAAVWLGDRDSAEVLLPMARRFAGLNLVASEFLAPLGSADRLLGSLESLLDLPTADDRFTTALEMDTRMGSTLHRATTLAEYVVHLRRHRSHSVDRRQQDRTHELIATASDLSDRYGLTRVRRRLGPIDVAASQPRGEALTPRETEVLALLGQGLSNRSIAAKLVISEYTAANHVRNILTKTRSTNRTQAAMYAAEHGMASRASGQDRNE